MSFRNPTPLSVGMSGTLLGAKYRVAGRVVMGMEQDGESYYWNEFNLLAEDGKEATLVFEETGQGGQWRLFTFFEPEYSIAAEDAATKRVGDPLNLDGTDVRVTLVDESCVQHIEGVAPEGVEVGDVARYFNAESDGVMIVVSWTGDEVECYHGEDLDSNTVAAAFEIPARPTSLSPAFLNTQDRAATAKKLTWVVITTLAMVVAIVVYASCRSPRRTSTLRRSSAPAALLQVGNAVRLLGQDYKVISSEVVDVAEVGMISECREYGLSSHSGEETALLLGGFAGEKKWCLFSPLFTARPLTPAQAASIRAGQNLNLDGELLVVDRLFQVTVRQVDSSGARHLSAGDRWYCLAARKGVIPFQVRWNEGQIDYYQGKFLDGQEVQKALGSK